MINEPHFDEYYCVLGPEKCKAQGYNTSRLKKDLGVITFSTEILTTEIYKEFKENQRISNAEIKQKLQKIYDLVGYSKKAKASDLEEFFEIKKITVQKNPTINGLELLKKK